MGKHLLIILLLLSVLILINSGCTSKTTTSTITETQIKATSETLAYPLTSTIRVVTGAPFSRAFTITQDITYTITPISTIAWEIEYQAIIKNTTGLSKTAHVGIHFFDSRWKPGDFLVSRYDFTPYEEKIISNAYTSSEKSGGQYVKPDIANAMVTVEERAILLTTSTTPDYRVKDGWIKMNCAAGVIDWDIRLLGYRWDGDIFEIDVQITNEGTTTLTWDDFARDIRSPVFVCRDQYPEVVVHIDEGKWYQDEYYPGQSRRGILRFEGLTDRAMMEMGLASTSVFGWIHYTKPLMIWE